MKACVAMISSLDQFVVTWYPVLVRYEFFSC